MDKVISHDLFSRMLNRQRLKPPEWWQVVQSFVRTMQGVEGVVTIDDCIVEKPYTDEHELIYWHYDQARMVKSINSIISSVHGWRGLDAGDFSVGVQDRIVCRQTGADETTQRCNQE